MYTVTFTGQKNYNLSNHIHIAYVKKDQQKKPHKTKNQDQKTTQAEISFD